VPEYLPPEAFLFLNHESKVEFFEHPSAVDVYGLGCTLVELFLGYPLWSPFRVMRDHRLRPVTALARARKNSLLIEECQVAALEGLIRGLDCSEDWKALLRKMVHPDPARRATPASIIDTVSKWPL
jgi:serine/threonine protein kinase